MKKIRKITSLKRHMMGDCVGGMNLPEVLLSLVVTGVMAAIAAPSISFASNPLDDSLERVQANFKLGRARAMSQTTAYRVRPNGADSFTLERHAAGFGTSVYSCDDAATDTDDGNNVWLTASGFNLDEDMILEEGVTIKEVILDGVDVTNLTGWELCFDSRGYANKNMILTLENTQSGESKMIEVFTGGHLVSYDSNRLVSGNSSPSIPEASSESTSVGSSNNSNSQSNCNQGIGNGPEGCDPGNSNNNHGSNDEG